ncbi:MAG: VanW family protein [Acidimicrobiales bacterium]
MTDRPSEGDAAASPLPDISDIIGTGLDNDAPLPPDPAGLDSAPADAGDANGTGTGTGTGTGNTAAPAGRGPVAGTIEAMVDGIEWADSPPDDGGGPPPAPAASDGGPNGSEAASGGGANGSEAASGGGANGSEAAPADGDIDLRGPQAVPTAPPAPPRPPQRPRSDTPADRPASAAGQPPPHAEPAPPTPTEDPATGSDDPTAPVPAGGFIVPPEPDEPPLDATQPIDVADLAATQAIPVTGPPKVGSNRLLDAVLAVERAEAAAARANEAAGPSGAARPAATSDDTMPFAPAPQPDATRPMDRPAGFAAAPFDPEATQLADPAGGAPAPFDPDATRLADPADDPDATRLADPAGAAGSAATPFDPAATAPAPPFSGAGESPSGDPAPAAEAGPSPALIAASTAAEASSGQAPSHQAPPDPASSGDPAGDADPIAAAAASPGPGGPDDGAGRSGRRRRFGGPLPLVGVGVLAVLALVTAAWGIDSARTDGEVMRGTRLSGTDIGGLDRDELATVFDDLDTGLGEAQLTATIDQVTVDTNPAALGAAVDRDRQTDAALAARRGGTAVLRPLRWLTSFVTSEDLDPIYEVEPEMAASGAQDILTAALDQPVDPGLVVNDGELALSEGKPGVQVDPDEVAKVLPAALAGPGPYEISLPAMPAEPRYTNDEVRAIVDEANTATSEPIEVRVLDKTAEVDPATMRSWIRLDSAGDEPAWAVDGEAALADLKPLFPSLGSEDERAHFNIVDNVPVIIPASSTIICCTAESVDGIADVMRQPPLGTGEEDPKENPDPERRRAELTPESVGADEGVNELASLGIVEEVSTFTTKHPCCQNRVTNIHRIADIVRGVVIRPGEDFSVNGYVGERTIAKGFVADHAIVDGVLKDQVGGGVSQFATTFFNASFFAGLDFNEYQSHSLYISRYPKGREATVSWKKPDLSVKNTTPYGILVWTSYTDTSLTVTFYSTKNVEVTAGELQSSPQGSCTRYTTPRTRIYPDGTKKDDSVFATYRPGEGVGCDGKPTKGASAPAGPTVVDPSVGAPTPQPVNEGGGGAPLPTLLDTPPDGG